MLIAGGDGVDGILPSYTSTLHLHIHNALLYAKAYCPHTHHTYTMHTSMLNLMSSYTSTLHLYIHTSIINKVKTVVEFVLMKRFGKLKYTSNKTSGLTFTRQDICTCGTFVFPKDNISKSVLHVYKHYRPTFARREFYNFVFICVRLYHRGEKFLENKAAFKPGHGFGADNPLNQISRSALFFTAKCTVTHF